MPATSRRPAAARSDDDAPAGTADDPTARAAGVAREVDALLDRAVERLGGARRDGQHADGRGRRRGHRHRRAPARPGRDGHRQVPGLPGPRGAARGARGRARRRLHRDPRPAASGDHAGPPAGRQGDRARSCRARRRSRCSRAGTTTCARTRSPAATRPTTRPRCSLFRPTSPSTRTASTPARPSTPRPPPRTPARPLRRHRGRPARGPRVAGPAAAGVGRGDRHRRP